MIEQPIGNENLSPESATSTELGLKYNSSNFKFSAALFNRNAKNIIDYVKKNEDDLWRAENIGSLTTKGYELDISYSFKSSYTTCQILIQLASDTLILEMIIM